MGKNYYTTTQDLHTVGSGDIKVQIVHCIDDDNITWDGNGLNDCDDDE